jgi:adenosine deaminase
MVNGTRNTQPLAELHAHLSSSIPPAVYWHIAQSEGYKLPKRDYREFAEYIVLSEDRKMTLREYLDEIYHPILDKLSAGAPALEKGVYESLSGAYRSNNITVLELRMNPMKHNREGEVDLDHAIMAMLRGMDRALLEYPKLKAGFIFCLDRQFPFEKNKIIVEKAIKYHRRGVLAIDFANYVFENHNPHNFHLKDYSELVQKARDAGLRVTCHSGEANDANNDMWDAVEYIKPDRIGHGIKAAYDEPLMRRLAEEQIVLEVCPLSNVMTKAVADADEMRYIMNRFFEFGVKFTVNTDWPETVKDAHLSQQFEYLRKHNILTEEQIAQVIQWSFEATFINSEKLNGNLYL